MKCEGEPTWGKGWERARQPLGRGAEETRLDTTSRPVGEGLQGAVLPWSMLRQDRSGEDQHGSRVVRARHAASGEDVVGVLLTIDEGVGALNGAQAVGSGGGSRMGRVEL